MTKPGRDGGKSPSDGPEGNAPATRGSAGGGSGRPAQEGPAKSEAPQRVGPDNSVSATSPDGEGTPVRKKRRRRKRGRRAGNPQSGDRPVQGSRPPAAQGRQPTANHHGRAAQENAKSDGRANTQGGRAADLKHANPPVSQDAANRPRDNRKPWHRERPANLPLYAALDLGTNNCRLLIASPTAPGRFRVVDAFSRIVRLGEGLTASGSLAPAAMDRAVEALVQCAAKTTSRSLRGLRLVATEACRAAENGSDFLARVRAETGLELEIVDRETEARLAVNGCDNLVDHGTEAVVLFDIGGGSTEIALIEIGERRSRRLSDHIVDWTSLPVGVVSLSERFGGNHVTPPLFDAMVADVMQLIDHFPGRERLAKHMNGNAFHLLGTSGTVTTLAGIHLGLERYDRRKVDGIWLTSDQVDETLAKLLATSFEDRVANACIGPDRADLVLAGCAIMEAIRKTWPSPRMRVADRGLREGILTELMSADGAWRRRRRGRRNG